MTEERIAEYVMLPATSAQVKESEQQALQVLEILKNWTLMRPEDELKAAGLMQGAHKKWKALDELRKEVTGPAVKAQRIINDHFRPAIDAWKVVKTETQGLIAQAEQVRQVANQARIESAAQGNASALAQIQETQPLTGVAYRDGVDIKIGDFNLVPREFLSVDWSKLRKWAKDGNPAPAGVTFTRVTKVQPTGR